MSTKNHSFITACFMLSMCSACSYNYNVGIPENTPTNNSAHIIFGDNFFNITIDKIPLKTNPVLIKDTDHTVNLPPGDHSFDFVYGDDGGIMRDKPLYISKNNQFPLTRYLEAGHYYEIQTQFNGSEVAFRIIDATDLHEHVTSM